MIVINTVSDKLFSLNGVNYVKNFLSFVAGNKVLIYNAYDRTDERTDLTIYSDYLVNGVAYGSAAALQSALIPVTYTRDSLGGTVFGTIPYYNKITAQTGFSLVGQDLTVNADWIWMLENLLYTNTADVVINIPYCATGYSRIDYVVPNNSNGFTVITGVESNTVPIAPTIPNEGMFVTWCVVDDGSVVVNNSGLGDIYLLKSEEKTYQAGANIAIDETDPLNPIISSTVVGGGTSLTDASLRIYNDGTNDVIGSNVSTFKSKFTWLTGNSTTFTLPFTPTNLLSIHVNGLPLYKASQYTILLPNQIQILQTLANNDVVDFLYEHYNS